MFDLGASEMAGWQYNEKLLKNALLEHVKGFEAPLGSGLKSQNAVVKNASCAASFATDTAGLW